MTNISQFSIETDVYLNHFSSDIFKNFDVDNQMSLSCGQDEPQSWPKNAFFSCVIVIYFVTFFFEQTVWHLYIVQVVQIGRSGSNLINLLSEIL